MPSPNCCLTLCDGFLRLVAPPRFDERRPWTSADTATLGALADRYRTVARLRSAEAERLAIGMALGNWLFGSSPGWREALSNRPSPLLLEVAVGLRPQPAEVVLIDAPWELLADAEGHWASPSRFRFAPHRRLGEAGDADTPKNALTALFMAASPEEERRLNFEVEERAILGATSGQPMELVVEETGTARELGIRLALEAATRPIALLHISCHGTASGPSLALEDELGGLDRCKPEDLQRELGEGLGQLRLLLLSACASADESALVGSFCRSLLTAGLPAALGWAGSVGDAQATAFAAALYHRLARGETIESAVAWARSELLNSPEGLRSDWHLARLLLGTGGGAVASARARPRPLFAVAPAWLDPKNREVPVAGPGTFVGRRRLLQAALRALRAGQPVLLHGMGRVGKSSLAARLVQRIAGELLPVVLFRAYDAESLLRRLEAALGGAGWSERLLRVRKHADSLESELREVLAGEKPFLLVIDDLEQILDLGAGQRAAVKPGAVGVLRAVFRAFHFQPSNSRLLLTSRYPFDLVDNDGEDLRRGLLELCVTGMPPGDLEKQAGARGFDPKETRAARAVGACLESPGLLSVLLDLSGADGVAFDRALTELEAARAGGGFPSQQALVDFFTKVAIERLVGLLREDERALLDASLLFGSAVPTGALEPLGSALMVENLDRAQTRLVSFGLWQKEPDLVHREEEALAPSALVRALRSTPAGATATALAGALLEGLLPRWNRRPLPDLAAYTLAKFSVTARRGDVFAANGLAALQSLKEAGNLREAGALATEGMALVEESATPVPLWLPIVAAKIVCSLGQVADARRWVSGALASSPAPTTDIERFAISEALRQQAEDVLLSGRGSVEGEAAPMSAPERALELLDRALEILPRPADRERAVVLGDIARIRIHNGEDDQALKVLWEILSVFRLRGDERDHAITLGDIAQIFVSKGDIDQALPLYQEALQVHNRLGNACEGAINLNAIARIWVSKGELKKGLRLHQEALKVFRRLGTASHVATSLGDIAHIKDLSGEFGEARDMQIERLRLHRNLGDLVAIASTLFALAQLDLKVRNFQSAGECLSEAFDLVIQVRRIDAIAAVGTIFGQYAMHGGAPEDARQILTVARKAAARLGDAEQIDFLDSLLSQLPPGPIP
jgi:tetratricopeptide (TPR) repeat protein